MNDGDDSSVEREIPKGVLRGRGRWQGDELEIERDRTTSIDPKVSAAVDLNQFRNEEVGKGYQAKHVIRQPAAAVGSKIPIEDLTAPSAKKAKVQKDASFKESKHDNESNLINKYLACEAFRKFRKEIENMI